MQIFSTLNRLYVAVIAGGQGTRLFPLSHDMHPKQFCFLDKESTFIQATMQRFANLGVKPARFIIVTTNPNQTRLANEQLQKLGMLSQNVLEIDPGFGYAGAMVEAARFISELDKDAVIINTPSDQHIVAGENFAETMRRAVDSAMGGSPTLVGVKVRDLNTVMGCGHAMYEMTGAEECGKVVGFVEKPNKAAADKLMRSDSSACNTGINVWRAEDLLAASKGLDLAAGVATDVLMERLMSKLKVAFGDFDWYDCGTLKSLHDISHKTPNHKNATLGEGSVQRHNCRGSLFVTPVGIELYASGIKNAAVVVNEVDGRVIVAVVRLEDSQKVRKLAEDYQAHKEMLNRDFSLEARNNRVAQTAISEEIVAVFVGVHRHTITPLKLPNGNLIISVSDDNVPEGVAG
jgi:mannose-1-phosphate guanylyltransferase